MKHFPPDAEHQPSRLHPEEAILRDRLQAVPEFLQAGYCAGEARTFHGVVIRRNGAVRGLWAFNGGRYRWSSISSRGHCFETASVEDALRHTMLMVLNSLLLRRAAPPSPHASTESPAAPKRS